MKASTLEDFLRESDDSESAVREDQIVIDDFDITETDKLKFFRDLQAGNDADLDFAKLNREMESEESEGDEPIDDVVWLDGLSNNEAIIEDIAQDYSLSFDSISKQSEIIQDSVVDVVINNAQDPIEDVKTSIKDEIVSISGNDILPGIIEAVLVTHVHPINYELPGESLNDDDGMVFQKNGSFRGIETPAINNSENILRPKLLTFDDFLALNDTEQSQIIELSTESNSSVSEIKPSFIPTPTKPKPNISSKKQILKKANDKYVSKGKNIEVPKPLTIDKKVLTAEKSLEESNTQITLMQSDITALQMQLKTQIDANTKVRAELDLKCGQVLSLTKQISFLESVSAEQEVRSKKVVNSVAMVSVSEATIMRKEIIEQETLIKGFHVENEKLVNEIKFLKNTIKETVERQEIEKSAKVMDKTSSVISNVEIANLERKILLMNYELDTTKSDLAKSRVDCSAKLHEITELKTLLDAKVSIQLSEKDHDLAEAGNQERFLELEVKLAQSIKRETELEGKLADSLSKETELRTEEIPKVDSKKSQFQEALHNDIKPMLTVSKRGHQNNSSNKKKVGAQPDSHQIEALVLRIAELEEIIAAGVRISKAENEKVKCLSDIQNDHSISEMEVIVADLELQLNIVQQNFAASVCETEVAKTEIDNLQSKIKSLILNSNELSTGDLEDYKKKDLRNRGHITELESLADHLALRNEQLVFDRDVLQKELAARLQIKDVLILEMQAAHLKLQQEVHDKLFLVDEPTRLHDLHKQREEIISKGLEIVDLHSRLEISDAKLKAVQDTTRHIINAQEESCKNVLGLSFEKILKDIRLNESQRFSDLQRQIESSKLTGVSADREKLAILEQSELFLRKENNYLKASQVAWGGQMDQSKFLEILNNKDVQITEFKLQVDSVLAELSQLKYSF